MNGASFQQRRKKLKRTNRHLPLLCAILSIGALSLGIIPPEELEVVKPQLEVSQNGSNLVIDWETHPEVFYFMEGTPDLRDGFWVTAKLLKDNSASGSLSLGTAIGSDHAFFRLSLEGDPDSARLRADDDGDGIINLLEVEAGWDAFLAEDPTDSDADNIPDYFEQFHFGTLAHDGSYVAAAGGLSLSTAFANATDPTSIDSDGDGWTDQQELEWGWNPNYDQSRDDGSFSQNGDNDGDGFSNISESLNGTNAGDLNDFPVGIERASYALIDLGQDYYPLKVGNEGHVFLLNEGDGPYYRRWHWGAVNDFERNSEWPEVPFSPGYRLNSMNNSGEIGGIYVSQLSEVIQVPGPPCGSIPNDSEVIRHHAEPVVIKADGTTIENPRPSLTVTYSSDSEIHEIIALNDNGDYLLKSAGATPVTDNVKTAKAMFPELRYFTGGNYGNNLQSVDIQSIIPLQGSCDGVAQYTGESLNRILLNNQGKIAGTAFESNNWESHSDLRSGDTFYFADSANNRVSYHPYDMNQHGWITGLEDNTYSLYIDSFQHALPSVLTDGIALSSPNTDEPLVIASANHLAIQKRDAISGNLLPLSDGAGAYFVQIAEEILHEPDENGQATQNQDWTGLSLVDVSDNANFLVGYANKNGITHAVMLLKMDLEEVWSNQFAGIQVNKLPGQSGHQGRPYLAGGGEEYLIVGPKSGTNTISLKVKFDAPDTPGLQDKIKFKILPSSSPVDAYHASPTTTSIDWSTKIATVEYELNILDENLYEGYETELSLLMYLDLDGNDQIDSPSDVALNSKLSNGDTFHLKFVFSNDYLNAAILGYFGGVFGGLNDWPDAANILNAFATGNVPNGAVDLNTTITISGDHPSHNNGVVFDNSGSGPSSNYVFDALSDMSERVLDSGDVTRHVRNVLDSNYDAVVSAFAQPENENETFLVMSFPISSFDERIGFSIDGNLFRTFGTANISGTVEAVVNKLAGSEGDVYQVDVVSVDANVTDLYDWDYDKGGDYDKPFALMQGGFDTIAPGGKIFKLRTRLDGHISDFLHFINPIAD